MFALAIGTLPAAGWSKPFHFMAFGDTAYKLPRDENRVEMLVDAINAEMPAFSIHVGDFKGYTTCSDTAYQAVRNQFRRLNAPLILSPGDNDWFDCSVDTAGKFDPLERLAALRKTFFSGMLGTGTLRQERQIDYPENARWIHEGIIFVTVHVIGPHNGFVRDPALSTEAIARTKAGEAWLRQAFATARQSNAPAIVIAFQADPWITGAPTYEDGPFDWLRNGIGEEAANFSGQVLVINGDSHRLTIDTPYRRADIEAGTTRGMNITRLMVPGWPDHRAVRVSFDPERPAKFGFALVMQSDEAAGAKP